MLNNLEFDHADIFADLAAIETQFHYFVGTIPGSGMVISNGRVPALERVLAHGCWTPVERFGVGDGWEAGGAGDERFAVKFLGETLGEVQWELLGEHNRLNALAAIAAARHVGVPPGQATAALGRFQNVRRRLEVKGTAGGVTVYDDFAHHPTAVRETVAALRSRIGPAERVVAVFEPRSYTSRTKVFELAFARAFATADEVLIAGAHLPGKVPEAQRISEESLVASINRESGRARFIPTVDAIVSDLSGRLCAGDHVLILSNGGFGGIHDKLLSALRD